MGEIASTYPTAGGLYFWASKLGSPAWGWFTGWFNLVGQIAVTAAIAYGCAFFMTSLLNLLWGYPNSFGWIYFLYGIILLGAALINMFRVRITALLNGISAWWHMVGVVLIVFILAIVPDHHRSISYVFGQTVNNSGFGGHSWLHGVFIYVFLTGLLMAQYTITGYDASAHMSEETRQASRAAAWGIVMSVVVSVIFGFLLLVAVTFAIPSDVARGGVGHRHVRRRVRDLRLPAPRRGDVRHPVGKGRGGHRPLHRHLDLGELDGQEVGRVPALHRRRRAVILHDRVGDLGVADDVRVHARRRGAGTPAVAARVPSRTCSDLHRGRDLLARVPARHAVALVRLHRLRRRDVDRGDRPLHRVRPADHPATSRGRPLRAWRVEPRAALRLDRLAGDPLDRVHLDRVLRALRLRGHPVEQGLRLEPLQLLARHGRQRVPALRGVVVALRPRMVQGAGARRHRGGAGADRARLRGAGDGDRGGLVKAPLAAPPSGRAGSARASSEMTGRPNRTQRLRPKVLELLHEPVDLAGRVVVDEADAERLLRESLRQGDAVPVVRVPDADA